MRCVVIDDEKPGLDLICSYIEEVPFLELSGAFSSHTEALEFLMKHSVDLIFSDIELNASMNGMQLFACLPERPLIIFITAHSRYAIDSYSLDAVDYLLKPVSLERFIRAANKAYAQRMKYRAISDMPEHETKKEDAISEYLFVKTENKLLKIVLKEILFIEAYGDYVKIHLTDGRIVLSLQRLSAFESKLSDDFVRVHRSYIVAIDKIDVIERRRIRIGKAMIPISESYQEEFFNRVEP
ncbi:LytR/AlgR family response regulator transcription factor [Alistipes finegoldii]|uniref:LytR/AlgR family response regulator transcription factor n=1 Tax=Alistipes finegoldii TaxID=214856 RepID=UPI003A927F53